jgi:hypothetical protein
VRQFPGGGHNTQRLMNDRRVLPLFLVAAALLTVAFLVPAGASAAVDPYFPAVAYGVGALPVAEEVGDLNGDGKPDIVVANEVANSISVLLDEGAGTFAPAVAYPVGDSPSAVAIGDLNEDGIPDLAVANEDSGTVSILLGAGGGMFDAPIDFPVGAVPSAVAIGDLNEDGIPDLAVTNEDSGTVSILLGKGGGALEAGQEVKVGEGPISIAIGEFDEDGRPDLVTANSGSNNVSIIRGNGNGTFAPAVDYAVGEEPISVAAADLNGDHLPDLVVANAGAGTVSVLHGDINGTQGTFGRVTETAVGGRPTAVAVADLNGDKVPDLAVVNSDGDAVQVLVGKPSPQITWSGSTIVRFGENVTGGISLAGGRAPTGTIVFRAYAASIFDFACSNLVWTSEPVSVEGDRSYALTPAFTPLAVGSYRIVAEYSGDAENAPVTPSCNFEAPIVTVVSTNPSFTVGATPTEASLGDPVTLTANATDPGNGVRPSGQVSFTANGREIGSAPIEPDGTASFVTTALPAGTDQVEIFYQGDANYTAGAAHGPRVTIYPPPLTDLFVSPSGGSYALDTEVTTIFSCVAQPFGKPLESCTDSNGLSWSESFGNLVGRGKLDTSTAGEFTYGVTARAEGGQEAASSIHYTVLKAEPTVTSRVVSPSVTVGEPIVGTATFTGGHSPGGSIGFTVYGPDDPTCAGPPAFESAPMPLAAEVGSPPFVPTDAGTYRLVATYSGDVDNKAVASDCGEAAAAVTVAARQGSSTGDKGNSPPPSETSPPAGTPPPPAAPPNVKLTYSPDKPHTPDPRGGPRWTFRWAPGAPGTTSRCRLDRGRFTSCASPKIYRGLKRGNHVFTLRSTAPDGQESPPRTVRFVAGRRQ